MNLKEIFNRYETKTIISKLMELYPDQKKNLEGYLEAIKELRHLKPIPSDVDITISPNFHVSGVDKNGTGYAIEWIDWVEWLGMKIDLKTLKTFSLLDIFCRCLWEMTFLGFSRYEISKKVQELQDMMNNIDEEEIDKDEF